MLETLRNLGLLPSLLLSACAAAALTVGTMLLLQRRLHQPRREEMAKLRHALRTSKAKLDELRHETEVLKAELLEWRRRSAMRQSPRGSSTSRFAGAAPASEPDAWVLGALLQGDGHTQPGDPADFADTQILGTTRH